uniref:Uncharacterized protein n=1 Tax=Tetranychus urticae TaxID=32264 RepID=T1K4M2_TETUR
MLLLKQLHKNNFHLLPWKARTKTFPVNPANPNPCRLVKLLCERLKLMVKTTPGNND